MKNSSMVVFLHGWGKDPKNFQPLIKLLSKDYHIVAPDLSDLAEKEGLSWRKFADNLNRLIGERKVYLIGDSLGGALALAMAAFYPKKVKAVIACEPVGIKIKRNRITWVFLLIKITVRALFYPEGMKVVPKLLFIFLKECVLHFRELYAQAKLVVEKDLEKYLAKIKSPVHLWWSQNSDILPLQVGEKLHQGIVTSRFEPSFSNKNHFWPLFEQEKVAEEASKIFGQLQEKGSRDV